MITSKLGATAKTTVPRQVRAALRLVPGDDIAYLIEDGRVILTKAPCSKVGDPFGSFLEWSSAADRKAYARL